MRDNILIWAQTSFDYAENIFKAKGSGSPARVRTKSQKNESFGTMLMVLLAGRLAGELDQSFLHARDLGIRDNQIAVTALRFGCETREAIGLNGNAAGWRKIKITAIRADGIK